MAVKKSLPMVLQLLIIDDDEEDRTLLSGAVASIVPNAHCAEAIDGLDAIEKLRRDPLPDFIFVDLNMPRLNGFQFLNAVRNDLRLKNVPVIVYTTSKQPTDRTEAFRLGAVHFITKPYKLSDLQHELQFVLKKKWLEIA
jgi:CheY-like chemotaxis protein